MHHNVSLIVHLQPFTLIQLYTGSIIFESNETNSTNQDWSIATNPRVGLTLVNQTYQITLLTAVDLDVTDVCN